MDNRTNRNSVGTKIKLCTVNICGMSERSKFALNKYIEDEQIDLLAVQEIDTTDQVKLELINRSVICDTNKAANKGAALYISDKFSITKLEAISKISKNIDSCWGLVVIRNRRYIIGNVYAKLKYRPAIKEIMKMLKAAKDRQQELKATGVILTGDFNARHVSWGDAWNNDYGKELVDSLDHTLYSISISKTPTFLCANGGSFIDFSIISNNIVDCVSSCRTDDNIELFSGAPIRGHVPLITELIIREQVDPEEISEKLDITKMRWEEWTQNIENTIEENEEMTSETNPYSLWNQLNGIITEATDTFGQTKKSCRHSKPYWTNTLTTLSKQLQAARKCWSKRNTDRNLHQLNIAKEAFDEERKKVCQDFLINKAKQLNSVEAQRFWKEFNKLFKKKEKQKIDPLDNGNNGVFTEPQEIEKCLFSTFFEAKHLIDGNFDDAFYNEINNLYEEIINDATDPINEDEDVHQINRDVTLEEINKAIKYTGNSVDNCNFHPTMFRHLGNKAKTMLQKLFNLCLAKQQWVWEAAEVIFLRKAGKDSYSKPGSYRPICLTSYIGKLLEGIIAIRIEQLIARKNHIDPDQEGFSKSKNTIRYLNRLHLGIKVDKENLLTVLCLFVDFEKAFDSVWKKGLIVKLKNLGIKGNVLKLIDNFLFSRKVALKINGKLGDLQQCSEYGLPQGSVLSPVLFKLYLSDFLAELLNRPDIVLYKFADDGTIKITARNSQTCVDTMEYVLECLQAWTKKWRMKINCDKNKTEVLCFNTVEGNKDIIPKQFKIGDKVIYRVSETKVLGLLIDEDLNYKSHSQEVLKSLHATWSTLCKYSSRHWGFNQNVMLYLVKALFISKLSYAAHIWINKENIKEINKLWYHVLKSITGAVLNISQNLAEVILGVPPIIIQAKINSIKHFLKLNIKPVASDRYKEFLHATYNDPHTLSTSLHIKYKEIFRFLEWKLKEYKPHFTNIEVEIVNTKQFGRFFELSAKASSYTQKMMNRYIEDVLWSSSLKTQFQLDGYPSYPNPSCSTLPIPPNTGRKSEVLLMSLMYKNNLLNSSLFKLGKVPSPLCSLCAAEEETADHILFRCNQVDEGLRLNVATHYKVANNISENSEIEADFIQLVNTSRNKNFVESCINLVNSTNLKVTVEL